MNELDRVREMVKRDGLEEFAEFAPIEELIARQNAEIDRLRAEVEALRKGPGVEELAGVLYTTLTLGDDAQAWIIAQAQARAVLRALGRDAG